MLICVVLAALSLTGCQALLEPRSTMSVDDVLDAFEPQPGLGVTDPRDVTAVACSEENPCSEAIRADEIAIFRFDDRQDAARFAASLGDNGYQSDWIVLEYPRAKYDTDKTRLSYAGIVDGMWTSD